MKIARIQKIRSSFSVYLPGDMMRELGITKGDYVSLRVKDKTLIITPVNGNGKEIKSGREAKPNRRNKR